MGKHICSLTNRDKTTPLPALLVSLIIHALFYLLISTTAVCLPFTAQTPSFDFIWIEPLAGSNTKNTELHNAPPESSHAGNTDTSSSTVEAAEEEMVSAAVRGEEISALESVALRSEPKMKAEKESVLVSNKIANHAIEEEIRPSEESAKKEKSLEKVKQAGMETARLAERKPAIEVAEKETLERNEAIRQAQEQARRLQEAEREHQAKLNMERLKSENAEKERLARVAAVTAENKRIAARKAESERSESSRIAREQAERERQAILEKKSVVAHNAEKEQLLREKAVAIKEVRAVPKPRSRSVPAVVEGPAQPQEKEPKGNFLPKLRGDLKLEIIGEDDVKISVHFKQFLKKRRKTALSKSEATRIQKLTPQLAKVTRTTSEAVIEVAGEGIYDFIAEPIGKKTARAAYVLTLYEGGSRAAKKSIGNREIHGKAVIVKILMPEGIRWDDDAVFSGSIEDSESVTKFITDTGLVWKEFSE